MPCRFQFSLRALLVALTVGCLGLGWKVEQARQRERAIDAIVSDGHFVGYENGRGPSFLQGVRSPVGNHFWLDLKTTPVSIALLRDAAPSPQIGSYLSRVTGLSILDATQWSDDDMRHIESLADGCLVVVCTSASHRYLRSRLPNCQVRIGTRRPLP